MVGKKKLSFLAVFLLAASILGGCGGTSSSSSKSTLKDKEVIKIGITQFIEH